MDNYSQRNDPEFVEGGGDAPLSSSSSSSMAQKANNLRDKVTDLGRRTVQSVDDSRRGAADALDSTASSLHTGGDRVADAAHTAARKVQATADYVRQTDLKGMAQEVSGLVKRYPGQSIAIAAALGFLLARTLRSD